MTESATRPSGAARILIATAVLVALVGIAVWKANAPTSAPPQVAASTNAPSPGPLTSQHNDAVADFALARKSGRPVYVLFHSLS